MAERTGRKWPTLDFNPTRRSRLKVRVVCKLLEEVGAELQDQLHWCLQGGLWFPVWFDTGSLLSHYEVDEPAFSSLFTNVTRKCATA